MAEQIGQQPRPAQARARLGGFEVGVRDSTFSQHGALIAVHATGAAGTPYANYPATSYCRQLPAETAAAILATPWFAQAQALRSDRITPVIDAGIAGQTAFFIEPAISGERVSQRLRNRTETTPAQAGRALIDLLEGVGIAWQAGFDLVVAPDTVRILDNGRAQVSLALSMCLNPKQGPGSDLAAQYQFSLLTAMMLSGKADQAALGIDQLDGADRVMAVSGFRERLGNLAEHVVLVLVKALHADPSQRYPTTQAFVTAYGEALRATADELAFGAIEAKNQASSGMASIYADLIKRYDENHPELVGPGGRLGGAFHSGVPSALPSQQPSSATPSAAFQTMPDAMPPFASLGNEPPLTPEIVAMLAGPMHEPSKPRTNPWFTFAAGTVVILAVFLFLAFLVIANS
jgi:hypothetical protein